MERGRENGRETHAKKELVPWLGTNLTEYHYRYCLHTNYSQMAKLLFFREKYLCRYICCYLTCRAARSSLVTCPRWSGYHTHYKRAGLCVMCCILFSVPDKRNRVCLGVLIAIGMKERKRTGMADCCV